MHFSPLVLPSPSQISVPSFPEKSNNLHLELKRYISNFGIFTLFIVKSHYENHGDVGGSEGKPKHNADVTVILYHRQGKETYSAPSSADWQRKWHEHSSLLSDNSSGMLWKENYRGQCHGMVPSVHTGLGNGLQIAMGEELGALYALWFPFLNHFGHKDTKGFVLLKRGGRNLWKRQV